MQVGFALVTPEQPFGSTDSCRFSFVELNIQSRSRPTSCRSYLCLYYNLNQC